MYLCKRWQALNVSFRVRNTIGWTDIFFSELRKYFTLQKKLKFLISLLRKHNFLIFFLFNANTFNWLTRFAVYDFNKYTLIRVSIWKKLNTFARCEVPQRLSSGWQTVFMEKVDVVLLYCCCCLCFFFWCGCLYSQTKNVLDFELIKILANV